MTTFKEPRIMKTMRILICIAAALLFYAGPAHAQRLLTTTTLSANVAATDNVISVTSSTGMVVGQLIWVDWEVLRIQSLNGVAGTSTLINVQRGVDGTGARAHDNAERILVSINNTDFHNTDPDFGADCARGVGQAAVLPWINTRTGTIFSCQVTTWAATNVLPITYGSIPTSF